MSPRRAPSKGLTFTPGNHTYRLDGKPVPGVTTILGVLDKPALPRWAARSVAEHVADNPAGVDALREIGRGTLVDSLAKVPWERRDDAGARGTAFHVLAEQIVAGHEVDVPESQVPLVESALAFMEDYDVRPILTEAAVGSREHLYAGTLDLIADSTLGRAIFDWKSGKKIYPRFALQLAAYAFAEFHGLRGDEQPLPQVEGAYGVHVRADGYDVVPLRLGREVFEEFLAIRAVFDINKRVEGDWRTPGSGYAGVPLTREESYS